MKSVSGYCVRQRRLLSNPVTYYIKTQSCILLYYTFLVPSPSVILKVPDVQMVGQLLPLECIMTTARGITSTMDIVWSIDGVVIKKTIGANISSSNSSSILYRDFYNISLLTTAEDSRVYKCKGAINTTPVLTAESSTTLNVIGK